MFKVNNKDTRTTPERRVSNVNFEIVFLWKYEFLNLKAKT